MMGRRRHMPPPPKQGHSDFRDLQVHRVRDESNMAYFQAKSSIPHSSTTIPIQYIQHCFQLLCSYTSLTYLVYVILTFQFDIIL